MIREIFLTDTRVSPEEEALYLFSGLVKCGWCGGNMTRKTVTVNGKKYVYLVCAENKIKIIVKITRQYLSKNLKK